MSLRSRRHIGSPGRKPGEKLEKYFQSPLGAKEIFHESAQLQVSVARYAGLYVWALCNPGLTPGATNMPSADADSLI